MAKRKCFVCAGHDPKCSCHKKEEKDRNALNAEKEFLANIWIKLWKFNAPLVHPLQSHERRAFDMFGPWIDRQGRMPVPKEVKRFVRIGL